MQKGVRSMADISQEIEAFRKAKKGREVRGSMISLAEKVNQEVEQNTSNVTTAITEVTTAASNANTQAGKANTAANTANAAADNANAVKQDLLDRLASGGFKGDKGDTGPQGPQGEAGVMTPTSGMFSLYLDPNTGDLWAAYPDGEIPPAFEYDSDTGELYYVTDEGGTT
jgi:hypothetical protein